MANNFQIVISAVDKATATVRKINDSFSRITRPITQIKRSMGSLGKEMGLDRIGKSMSKVGKSASVVAGKISSVVAPMAAVVGVGSIAGVAALATEWGHLGFEIAKTSANLGMATSDLQSLRGAAQLAGVSAGELTGGLKSVGDTMEDALFGRNQSALMLLNKMNIGIHKTADGSIDAARGFKDIATYISGIKSAQVQGLVARQFGLETALPLLRKGAKGIEEYQRKVQEFGGSQSQGSINAAENFGLSLNYLSLAAQGLKTTIGDKLVPILQPFIEKLTSWVSANRDLIATRVSEFVEGFANWIERINFDEVLKGITDFIRGIGEVVDWLGGWKSAALLVMGVMAGPFLLSIATFGGSLLNLASVTIPFIIRALGLLRLAMLANPITAIVLAVATAALLIYENWDKVKRWWHRLWGDMSDDASSGQKSIADSADKLANGAFKAGGGKFDGRGASGDWESAPDSNAALGVRNNNPGNLRSWGNVPRVGGYATFSTPEAGLTAMINNLQAQQSKHGLNTIAGIIGKWAPPGENNTAAYIADMEKQTGFKANQQLDLTDKKTVAPLVSGIIKHEGNSAGFSKSMVDEAVTRVVVDFKNAPAGTTATAKSKGGDMVPVRVSHSMPSLAAG